MDTSEIINEDLICPECSRMYEYGVRVPQILNECGHAICSECLKVQLQKGKEDPEYMYTCPEDQELIEVCNLTMHNFPKNQALLRLLDKTKQNSKSQMLKDSSQNLSKISQEKEDKLHSVDESNAQILQDLEDNNYKQAHSPPQQYFQREMCEQHAREKDIICITERIKICSHCALFGGHNGHIMKSNEEIIKEQAQKAQDHLNIFCTIEQLQKQIKNGELYNQIKLSIEQRKQALQDQIVSHYQQAMQCLQHKQQMHLEAVQHQLKNINNNFIMMDFNNTMQSQLNQYKMDVNTILADFSNSCDTNTICYSLFQDRSDQIRQTGSSLQQQIMQFQEEQVEQVSQELNQFEVTLNPDHDYLLQNIVQIGKKGRNGPSSGPKPRNTLVADLTLIQYEDEDILGAPKRDLREQHRSQHKIEPRTTPNRPTNSTTNLHASNQSNNSTNSTKRAQPSISNNHSLVGQSALNTSGLSQNNSSMRAKPKGQSKSPLNTTASKNRPPKRTRLHMNFKVQPKFEPELAKLRQQTSDLIDLTQAGTCDVVSRPGRRWHGGTGGRLRQQYQDDHPQTHQKQDHRRGSVYSIFFSGPQPHLVESVLGFQQPDRPQHRHSALLFPGPPSLSPPQDQSLCQQQHQQQKTQGQAITVPRIRSDSLHHLIQLYSLYPSQDILRHIVYT